MRSALSQPQASSIEISNEYSNLNISARTIRRILFSRGLKSYKSRPKPFLTKKMVLRRLKFARKYKDASVDFWDRVFFADESYIEINPSTVMNSIRRFPTTDPLLPSLTRKRLKYPLKVMIWSCFNANGIGRIHICEGSMTSEKYKNVLEKYLLPSINDLGVKDPILLDDSARPHRTQLIKNWLDQNQIESVEWPGNSPDLNPIENLWGILKHKIRKTTIFTKRTLIEKIIYTWNYQIEKSVLRKLSDSMTTRIHNLIKNKGQMTKY